MLWLQDNEEYDKLMLLDPDGGQLTPQSRRVLGSEAPTQTDGFFAFLGGVFVALYRCRGELVLRVGHVTIPLADDIVAEVAGPSSRRVLSVLRGGHEIVQHVYAIDASLKFLEDPTPFVDDEDFDFGLYVANISQNRKRKEVMFGRA